MKYIKIILLLLPMLGLISCVKQKNCEEGESGTFEYLEESITVNPYCKNYEKKVVAIFRPIDDGGNYMYTGVGRSITGSVPEKYKTSDLIKVKACVKRNVSRGSNIVLGDGACLPVYKLTCIEKED